MLDMKIGIVGGNGVIGKVLQEGLSSYAISSFGREVDVRNYQNLCDAFVGKDIIIHLALNPSKEKIRENYLSGEYDPDNSLMNFNVYKAALETGVRRVIMASSVHADNFYTWKGPELLSLDHNPTPDSPYGANKLFMEYLGKYYSTKGLEVVCIRFGGVNKDNKQPEEFYEHNVWLSHADCQEMIQKVVEVKNVPNNFSVFYAVSNNDMKIHDTSNPFGWEPK